MSEQNDVLARYAALRARLDQPVGITELIAPAFRAVYDLAVAQRLELAQANALWQEHGLQAQLNEARRGLDKHGERARLAEAEADQLRQELAEAQYAIEEWKAEELSWREEIGAERKARQAAEAELERRRLLAIQAQPLVAELQARAERAEAKLAASPDEWRLRAEMLAEEYDLNRERTAVLSQELAACQRSRTLLHLEVAVLQAEASGDFAQARAAQAAYLAAAGPAVQP